LDSETLTDLNGTGHFIAILSWVELTEQNGHAGHQVSHGNIAEKKVRTSGLLTWKLQMERYKV
jgi:hypothetical protein